MDCNTNQDGAFLIELLFISTEQLKIKLSDEQDYTQLKSVLEPSIVKKQNPIQLWWNYVSYFRA